MKEVVFGLALGLAICAVGYALLFPYYSLAKLKDIAETLELQRVTLEKICKAIDKEVE